MLANFAGPQLGPFITIDMKQAEAIADVNAKLAKYYGWDAAKLGPVAIWGQFAIVMGGVYIPKIMIVRALAKHAKMQKAAERAKTAEPPSFADAAANAHMNGAEVQGEPAKPAEPVNLMADIAGLERA